MPRKASLKGLSSNITFNGELFSLTPSSSGLEVIDKVAKKTITIPADHMNVLVKVIGSVKNMYEEANPEPDEDDEDDETDEDDTSAADKLEALIAA